MGYSMYQRTALFFIASSNADAALAAVKGLRGRETTGCAGAMHFMYVEPEDFLNATKLADAFSAWRWDATESNDGDVIGLHFIGESHGDEDLLFAAIAPFVRPGSHIEVVGEDGAVWRWALEDRAVYVLPADVTFPGPADAYRVNPVAPFPWRQFRRQA